MFICTLVEIIFEILVQFAISCLTRLPNYEKTVFRSIFFTSSKGSNMLKRQSTVAKLSSVLLRQLVEFCKENNCGIILRFSGVEEGYTVDELVTLLAGFSTCEIVPCVRKGWNFTSDECLDAINLFATEHSRTTFGACQRFLGLRADSQANIDTIAQLARLAWDRLFTPSTLAG